MITLVETWGAFIQLSWHTVGIAVVVIMIASAIGLILLVAHNGKYDGAE